VTRANDPEFAEDAGIRMGKRAIISPISLQPDPQFSAGALLLSSCRGIHGPYFLYVDMASLQLMSSSSPFITTTGTAEARLTGKKGNAHHLHLLNDLEIFAYKQLNKLLNIHKNKKIGAIGGLSQQSPYPSTCSGAGKQGKIKSGP
jgi:hypothetical protein